MRRHSRFMGLPVLALVGFSIPALASTEAANTVSISSTLRIHVTVQNVVHKPVEGAATGACAVHASGYSMSFENVKAAGINARRCQSEWEPTPPGGPPASRYAVVMPVFTKHAAIGTQGSGDVGVTVRPTHHGKAQTSGWDPATRTHTITVP